MTENGEGPRFFIDVTDEGQQRSVSLLIANRRCYEHREEDYDASAPEELIQQVTEHCKDTPDYLLPDTPLKEAIFRTILAGGNEPMTREEVSRDLSARWAMSAHPRDLAPWVIQRLMDHSEFYRLTRVPEPEPPPEEASEEEVAPPTNGEAEQSDEERAVPATSETEESAEEQPSPESASEAEASVSTVDKGDDAQDDEADG